MAISKRLHRDREKAFPKLHRTGYEITSDADDFQNCIAFAAGRQTGVWTPYGGHGYYWPPDLPRKADVDTFVKLYELEAGYVSCDTGELQAGFEKIAIYVDSNNEVTHAAKQNRDGTWTSKLGDWEDIRHRLLEGLEGDYPAYGRAVKFLRRPAD